LQDYITTHYTAPRMVIPWLPAAIVVDIAVATNLRQLPCCGRFRVQGCR
jgi:hypothetical protein